MKLSVLCQSLKEILIMKFEINSLLGAGVAFSNSKDFLKQQQSPKLFYLSYERGLRDPGNL